ncbi:MAG TPA: aminopeptidase P N-terminal domain-containing protein, partial [Terriglobia bacterium]
MGIDTSEFQARRQSVMNAASDGIVLLHSFSGPKSWRDSGFQQDSNFYYLTGLENLHDAILALDGTTKESWLFVMAPTERQQRRFSGSVLNGWDSVCLTPNHGTEQALGIEHIVVWDGFADFIETRRKANPKVLLYLDQSRQGKMVADVSNPPGLAAIENPYLLWSEAIKAKWPDANIVDASPALQNMRAVKSPAEIALMKKSAACTDAGFRAAMAAIAPGRTNREIEGAAIEGALRAGADGISMWPELKTGPVSSRTVFQKFYDYHLLNRTVQAGETVLMDLGFNYEFYKGDVGRMLPVSGHFTPEQREVIELMDGAYQSGLQAMHDGVNANDIIQTSIHYVENHKDGLHSDLAKGAALELLKPGTWVMYTHGLDTVEIYPPKELHSGNTVAFGPDFDVDGQGFYEEDVVLIIADGHQLINPPLPYLPADIEKMMARLKRSQKSEAHVSTNTSGESLQ